MGWGVFGLGIQHALGWQSFKIRLMPKSLRVWNCYLLDICTVQPCVISSWCLF